MLDEEVFVLDEVLVLEVFVLEVFVLEVFVLEVFVLDVFVLELAFVELVEVAAAAAVPGTPRFRQFREEVVRMFVSHIGSRSRLSKRKYIQSCKHGNRG